MESYLRSIRLAYKGELAFYKSFHTNKVNWAIHAITIPFEWTATLLFLSIFNLHWVLAVGTGLYHLVLGTRISLAACAAQIVFCMIAERIFYHIGVYWSGGLALLVHAISWAAQVLVGHRMYERNLPAMATKLTINSVFLSVLLAWDSY
jgi:uncharacterized membrane protein YGL010W